MALFRLKDKFKKEQGGTKKVASLALFVFIAGIFLQPQTAKANAGESSVGLGFGEILLMGDFAKNFSDAIGFNLIYDYEASNLFGMLLMASYSSHDNPTTGGSLSMMGLTPDLKVNLAYIDKLTVYAMTGFGVMKVSENLGGTLGSASVTTLDFNLGAGFELRLAQHLQFGTSLSFFNVFGKTDDSTVTTSNPQGISVGGTYMRLFLDISYIF